MLGQGSVESGQEGVVVLLPGIKQSLLLQGGGGEVGDSDVLSRPQDMTSKSIFICFLTTNSMIDQAKQHLKVISFLCRF